MMEWWKDGEGLGRMGGGSNDRGLFGVEVIFPDSVLLLPLEGFNQSEQTIFNLVMQFI